MTAPRCWLDSVRSEPAQPPGASPGNARTAEITKRREPRELQGLHQGISASPCQPWVNVSFCVVSEGARQQQQMGGAVGVRKAENTTSSWKLAPEAAVPQAQGAPPSASPQPTHIGARDAEAGGGAGVPALASFFPHWTQNADSASAGVPQPGQKGMARVCPQVNRARQPIHPGGGPAWGEARVSDSFCSWASSSPSRA